MATDDTLSASELASLQEIAKGIYHYSIPEADAARLDTDECPLLAQSGHWDDQGGMTALEKSGHWADQGGMAPPDP